MLFPRAYTSADHPTLTKWWEAHQWPAVPEVMLPPRGYVIEGVCAGFLYATDSPLCWLEWIVANPESDKLVRNDALNILIETLVGEAKRLGFKAVFSSTSHAALIERYKALGFVVSDSGMTNLIRSV